MNYITKIRKLLFMRVPSSKREKLKIPKKNDRILPGRSFWWEWVDSNHLRLKPTDLQSAPALQLRRTPNLGAGSGNRTRISSLEGLHTSLCTMPATNKSVPIIIHISKNASIYSDGEIRAPPDNTPD